MVAAALSAAPVRVGNARRGQKYLPAIEGIQSELAVPLIVGDRVVGVLDLESEKKGFFTSEHVRTLSLLAPHLAASIENASLYSQVSADKIRIEGDLAAARDLQQSLLGKIPEFPGVDVSAYNIPAAAVSGDFYDFIQHGGDLLRVFMGDVSGKGAAAALFAALASGAFHQLSSAGQTPSALLASINRYLAARNAAQKFVAATVVDWRPAACCLVLSYAGGVDSVLVRDGSAELLRVEGLPLGLFDHAGYEEVSIPAGPGDMLVLVSDGILDRVDNDGREYGSERLIQTILEHKGEAASALIEGILESVRQFSAGVPPQDDQTLVVLKIQPHQELLPAKPGADSAQANQGV